MPANLYSIIDIETTGGNAWTDRITEIAIYVYDGQRVIREFSSLVNPQRSIPPFVVKLTGITDEMVENAPLFEEIAREIVDLTEGTIFVGHNVQFDYSFVRQEFKALGFNYDKQTLCSCRLARKLIPGHPSYSLGRICYSLGIEINGRHRAAGDAAATVKLFEKILEADTFGELDKELKPARLATLPECLDVEKVYSLPENPGVYYFHDNKGEIIYVGKSKNIRKRVLSHFKKKTISARDARLRHELSEITFLQTGTELIALLLESDEIKKHLPRYNKSQKEKKFSYGIFDYTDEDGYINLFAEPVKKNQAKPLACFKNLEQALLSLQRIVDKNKLCSKLCGLEKGNSACFSYQVKKCQGACLKLEKPDDYNKKVTRAMESFNFNQPHFLIIDNGRNSREKSVVRVENGHYHGFGYFEPAIMGNRMEDIKDVAIKYPENPDTRHIIHSHLRSTRNANLFTL